MDRWDYLYLVSLFLDLIVSLWDTISNILS